MHQTEPTEPAQYMTVEEVMAVLRVGRSTVVRMIKGGAIAALKVGDGPRPLTRVNRASFDAYCQRREAELTGPRSTA